MKTLTVKMPAFLASALINGDTSGLGTSDCGNGKSDLEWHQVALAYCAPGSVVSTACTCGAGEEDCRPGCGDSYFSWHCDLPGWGRFGADMLDYVVIYPEGK